MYYVQLYERSAKLRRWRHHNHIGKYLITVGVLIVLSMVLPSCVWWVILAAALIVAGIIILFRC